MAATRKLQGEEKVFPVCLHLDILRRPADIGLDGRLAVRVVARPVPRRRSPAIPPLTRACEPRRVATRDSNARFPAHGISPRSRGQFSVVARMATTARRDTAQAPARARGLYPPFLLSRSSPYNRGGSSTVDDTATLYFVSA